MATAESCTGGLIAKLCTDRAGSSDWFLGGVVAYANALKTTLLGVPEETIAENGAVSGPVVRAMALGALEKLGADCSVAVSGIAGPGGGSADKPVGTVWMAVAMRVAKDEGESLVTAERMLCLPGSRDDVRLSAALAVLESLVEML